MARAHTDHRRHGRGAARPPGVGVLAALEGIGLVAVHLLATPVVGRRRRRWGTRGSEPTDALPGDELVPRPRWSYTLGVTVEAPPEAIWPWIAQLGQGRGGFYSYETLENLFGCRITNTTEILPDHQHPAVGDEILLHPGAPPMRVEIVEPPTALVLLGSPAAGEAGTPGGITTWQFAVRPGPTGTSRLLTRGRYDHTSDWWSRLALGPFPLEAISFVMSRRMMLEIKRLAEGTARVPDASP